VVLLRQTQFLMLVSLVMLCPILRAQSVSLADALAAARFPLTVTSSGFAGMGAHVLTQALDEAQFVAIGEDHLTRETPRFTAAVCDQMAPHGLNAMALETSPMAAQFVEGTLGRPDRIDQMASLQRRFPDSIAFLSDRQENDLVEHCAEAARGDEFHLWGLDQEFLGAAGWLIQTMLETNPGPRATAALQIMQKDEQRAAADAARSGSSSNLYLMSATDAQIAAAQAGVQADGRPLTRRILASAYGEP
jgi:hypothetical protein